MAPLYRFRMDLGGFEGAPGVNILHTTTGAADDPGDMGNFMTQMRNGWESVKAYLLGGVTASVNPEVIKFEASTGKQLAFYNVTPPAQVLGMSASTNISRATQVVCRHNGDGITDLGKRNIGRTYMGPVGADALDSQGHVAAAAMTAFQAMWDGMQDVAGTCRLVVWHRPRDPGTLHPEDPGTVGSFGHVQTTTVLSKPGVLRGRRD